MLKGSFRWPAALAAMAAAAVLAAVPIAGVLAAAKPAFGTAVAVPLPANSAKPPYAALAAVTCTGNRACVAGGNYTDAASGTHPWVATQAGSRWKQATELRLPADAAADPSAFANITGVGCVKASSCVAVGLYRNTAGDSRLLIFTGSGTRWSAPLAPALPPGAQSGELNAVSCTAAGFCAAVGEYVNAANHILPIAITRPAGKPWSAVRVLPLPGDAGVGQPGELTGISCPAASSCVAVGHYYTSTAVRMLVLVLSGARWQAIGVTPPAGAATYPPADLAAVSCAKAGTCLAIGTYYLQSNLHAHGVSVAVTNGRPGPAGIISALPAGGVEGPDTSFRGVSCAPSGPCVAVGSAANKAGHSVAMYLVRSGGKWAGSLLGQPANAETGSLQRSLLEGVACTGTGHCTTAGYYTTAGSNGQTSADAASTG